ncbi:MAG: hypothetical protein SPG60_03650 [Eubacterium coprostanoligenes]|nr:hypothetical protein [Eubacterium coprostanoligenes]
MTIDYALDIYTDKIIDNEKIDLNDFKLELSATDYELFLEEIETINILFSYDTTSRFKRFLKKLDDYVDENIQMKHAANFRSEELDDSETIEIDKIFDELFDND